MDSIRARLFKILNYEQDRGHQDTAVIGGLEKHLDWLASEAKTPPDRELLQLVRQRLGDYHNSLPEARRAALAAALESLGAPGPTRPQPAVPTPHLALTTQSVQRPRGEDPKSGSLRPIHLAEPEYDQPEEEEGHVPPAPLPLLPGPGFGLDAPISRLQGVGPKVQTRLEKLRILTVRDILFHFPHRYNDYRDLKKISELVLNQEASLAATVLDCKSRTIRNRLTITNVLLGDQTGTLQISFWNQPYVCRQFRIGSQIVISGRVERSGSRPTFSRPEWEPLSKELLHTGRIVPVYPVTEGIPNKALRRWTSVVVDHFAALVPDPLPLELQKQAKLVDLTTALRDIHFPASWPANEAARRRLAFDEFLIVQIGVLRQRLKWQSVPGKPLAIDTEQLDPFLRSLPFTLTGAQQRVLNEILGDIRRPTPMSRLLQGDVGSGKTVVAAAALLAAIAAGSQGVLMAPTEILAEQHFKTLSHLFDPSRFHVTGAEPRVGLLTGSLKNREKEQMRQKLATGEVNIAIGTHALIQEHVVFRDLALAVVDEQHRFGVAQRSAIRQKGFNPHILVMSATPIPRTLALTVYGDLDLSVIDELPPGRQQIQTKWLEPGARERAYSFVRKQVAAGRQAFVICPLIDESEVVDAKAAVEEYERLRTEVYPDLKVGLVHGKLRPSEKEAAMSRFREGEIDILVATSVVEVGIDVPNATVMLIEGADRFGLAQLHQFRGRVGRGAETSYCLLLAEKKESAGDQRLQVIETTHDGFHLAEADLKMRGPGEFFGTRQSGLPDLKVAKLSDVKLLELARSVAQALFQDDPQLARPEHRTLAENVDRFWRGEGDLS